MVDRLARLLQVCGVGRLSRLEVQIISAHAHVCGSVGAYKRSQARVCMRGWVCMRGGCECAGMCVCVLTLDAFSMAWVRELCSLAAPSRTE